MHTQQEQVFYKISNGYKNAYSEFIKHFELKIIGRDYLDLIKYLITQNDLSKCDYNAIYDASRYLIEASLNGNINIKSTAKDLYKNLLSAAEKNNVAAQCVCIILNNTFNFDLKINPMIETARRNALAVIAKNKNNIFEKTQWAYLFLSIYSNFCSKDKNENEIKKYLDAARLGNNPVAIHFGITVSDSNCQHPEKLYHSLSHYYDKPYHLISINLLLSQVHMALMDKNRDSVILDKQSTDYVRQMLYCFREYNIALCDYNLGLHEFHGYKKDHIYTKLSNALKYFISADKAGHHNAKTGIDNVTKELEAIKTNIQAKNFESIDSSLEQKRQKHVNRKFLHDNNNKQSIHIHNSLPTEKQDSHTLRIIEKEIYNDILNEIRTNNRITKISISANYAFDLDLLLDAVGKNLSIETLSLNNYRLTLKEYFKIFHFLTHSNHIQHIHLNSITIDYPSSDSHAYTKLVNNTVFNFIAKVKHLKSLEIDNFFHEDDEISQLLATMKKNPDLYNTKIILGDCDLNNQTLMLLSDLIESGFTSLDIISERHDVDAKYLRAFTEGLKGNKSLQHLGLRMFISGPDCERELIVAFSDLVSTLITETNIESLDLSETLFHVEAKQAIINSSIKQLCSDLKRPNSLKSLKLCANVLSDNDFIQIAYIFKTKNLLQKLDLSDNILTNRSLKVLTEVLSNYPNNLTNLNLGDFNPDDTDLTSAEVYESLSQLLMSPFCKLEKLGVPLINNKTKEDDKILFEKFILLLSTKHTLRKIVFFGTMTNYELSLIVNLINKNQNIKYIRYFEDHEQPISLELKQALNEQLNSNRSLLQIENELDNLNTSLVLNDDTESNAASRVSEPVITRSSINTFVELLDSVHIHYNINSIKDDSLLNIELEDEYTACIIARTFNNLKDFLTLDGKFITINNYKSIAEIDILSKSYILSTNLQRCIAKQNYNTTSFIDYFSEFKYISFTFHEDILNITLNENYKMNADFTSAVLNQIVEIFKSRNIVSSLVDTHLEIANYNSISVEQTSGLASEIKRLIKDHYTKYKQSLQKESYSSIQTKLHPKKIKKVKLTKNNEAQRKENSPISIPPSNMSDTLTETSIAETLNESIETSTKDRDNIEVISYKNAILEKPTDEKFRKLAFGILNESIIGQFPKNVDKIMFLILSHHTCLLTNQLQALDTKKAAYCVLYHSIRLSELTHQFINQNQSHHMLLSSSAYKSRAILADRPDYFLPHNPERTIQLLLSNPKCYLTVSRLILMELFDETAEIKIGHHLGFTNLSYYKDFYNNDQTRTKLPLPTTLTENPLAVLENMIVVIDFIQSCMKDLTDIGELVSSSAFTNLVIGSLKGALFLLGHFARVLRDHHLDFCQTTLNSSFVKNNFSKELYFALSGIFESQVLNHKNFCLLNYLDVVSFDKIETIAKNSSFSDNCLLFINVRNTIGHSDEDDFELNSGYVATDEISSKTVAYLCSYFASSMTLKDQIQRLIDNAKVEQSSLDNNSVQVMPIALMVNSLVKSLNPKAPISTLTKRDTEDLNQQQNNPEI